MWRSVAVGVLDMAGLAQKGGAVHSHMRIAQRPEDIHAIRIAAGAADLVLGGDMVVAGNKKVLAAVKHGSTVMVVNVAEFLHGDFTRNPDFSLPTERLRRAIIADAGPEKTHFVDASRAADALFGNTVGANIFLVGYAYQLGAVPLAATLRLPDIPVVRVENACASASDAFRGAVYAVASGAADIALALGVEKLKDTGYGGLPQINQGTLTPQWYANYSTVGGFAQVANAYAAKHGYSRDELKRALAHISVKSHANALKSPKAHLRKEITEQRAAGVGIEIDEVETGALGPQCGRAVPAAIVADVGAVHGARLDRIGAGPPAERWVTVGDEIHVGIDVGLKSHEP